MCKFFSITSDGNGDIRYFDWEMRKRILSGEIKYDADSHTSINDYYGYKGADEDCRNKYEYNPFTKVFTIDTINSKDDSEIVKQKVKSLDFRKIVEPLIIKPIVHPFKLPKKEVGEHEIKLLKQWVSVRASVSDSVRASVWVSVWYSVWVSVRDSVRDSVWDSVWAYMSSFFNIEKWKYTENKPYENPFAPCIELWENGFVPSFDGKIWRLHSGKNADVIFEISQHEITR